MSIFILDAYHINLIGSVVNCIQVMGNEVLHNPASCTYLCIEPAHRYGKKQTSEDCNEMGGMDGKQGHFQWHSQEASELTVVNWHNDAYTNIPEQMDWNAWTKGMLGMKT